MERRTFLQLLPLPVLAALLASCSDDEGGGGDDEPGDTAGGTDPADGPDEGDVARSELARTATVADDAFEASASVNDFGMQLYRRLATAQPDGNFVFSPASTTIALAMAMVGAKADTLGQMASVMSVMNPTTFHHAMNSLTAQLDRRNEGDVELSIANSLWVQRDLELVRNFLDVLATEYGAGVNLVDYRADAEAARQAINAWVADETADRIPELLAPNAVSGDTRLALVNAIYLKAPWLLPFLPDNTRDTPFTTVGGERVQVPSMVMTETLQYATGDGWTAVELPYDSLDLSMLVFLPEEGSLVQFEEIFLPTDASRYLSPTLVTVQLPKFDFGSAFGLSDTLIAMGMVNAHDEDLADFTGITAAEPVYIGAVIHQANITVDEAGTEAAAATAIVMPEGAAPPEEEPPQPVLFIVDRPFVFVIRDRSTDSYLFLGRVGDPRA